MFEEFLQTTMSERKKKPLYLSVNVFSTPSGDGTAILRGYPSNAKVYPFAGQSKYLYFSVTLRPWVLVRSRLSSPRPPAQQSSALPADLILLRLNEPKFKRKRKLRLSRKTREKQIQIQGRSSTVYKTNSFVSGNSPHFTKKVYERPCKKKKNMQILENG